MWEVPLSCLKMNRLPLTHAIVRELDSGGNPVVHLRRVKREELNQAYKATLACALVFEEVGVVVGVPERSGLPKA